MTIGLRVADFCLLAGAVLLPLQIWPSMPLPGMQPADLLFGAGILAWLAARPGIPTPAVALPVLAFLCGAAVSAALSGGVYAKLAGHAELAALAWIAACMDRPAAVRLRRALVVAAGLAAAAAAAAAALYFAGIETPLLNPYGQLQPGDYPRVRGTMLTANMAASTIASGLLLLWFEPALVPRAGLRRALWAAGTVALVFTFSRTLVAVAIVLPGIELARRRLPARLALPWAAASLAALAALWLSMRYQVTLDPTAPWKAELHAADSLRFSIWREVAGAIAGHPLFGIGPGRLPAAGWSAHNAWLNVWALLGVVPLAAFAWLMAAGLAAARRAGATGVGAALLVALIDSSHADVEDMRHLWLLLGLAFAGAEGPARQDAT